MVVVAVSLIFVENVTVSRSNMNAAIEICEYGYSENWRYLVHGSKLWSVLIELRQNVFQ